MRASGHPAPNDLLAHVAPLGWTHISLTGDYLWHEPAAGADDFLPLRLNERLTSVALSHVHGLSGLAPSV